MKLVQSLKRQEVWKQKTCCNLPTEQNCVAQEHSLFELFIQHLPLLEALVYSSSSFPTSEKTQTGHNIPLSRWSSLGGVVRVCQTKHVTFSSFMCRAGHFRTGSRLATNTTYLDPLQKRVSKFFFNLSNNSTQNSWSITTQVHIDGRQFEFSEPNPLEGEQL